MSAAPQLSRRGLLAVGAATAALPLPAPSAAAARAAGKVRCAPCAFRNAEMVGGQAVAVSADGKRIVWSPADPPVSWSDDHAATWTATKGLPGAPVRSDPVNAAKFHAYRSGAFYLSTDGGKSFEAAAATGLPTAGNVRFKAVPGHEGDIWLPGGTTEPTTPTPYGLWRSTDSGASLTRFEAVDEGDVVGFGKAATRRHVSRRVHRLQDPRRARHLPVRRRGPDLDPHQRRPTPVRLDRQHHDRRPPGPRSRLLRDQRARSRLRRPGVRSGVR